MRYVVIVHQNKIQKYGFFDTPMEAEGWWMEHKTPFFENDRPKGWGFGFVATYDTLEKRLVEWNTLYLNEEIVNGCVSDMLSDLKIKFLDKSEELKINLTSRNQPTVA